jgi:hypothetical protein
MPIKKLSRRSRFSPVELAVVRPDTKRLPRIECILIEMRSEQDRHLKRIAALQRQLDNQRNGEGATALRPPKQPGRLRKKVRN